MGTRLFCDHCGNTVQKFTIVAYGGLDEELDYRDNAMRQMVHAQMRATQNLANPPPMQAAPAQPKPRVPIIRVELCDRCVEIWMKRAADLCKASDV